MASPELLLFFYAHFFGKTGPQLGFPLTSPNSLCPRAKPLGLNAAKPFTTEGMENTAKSKTGAISLAEDDAQTAAPVFSQCDPRDFDFRG
jgi:hypothetical protein